jgi:hypothetical protein
LPLFEITSSAADTGARCAGTTDDYSGRFEYITLGGMRFHDPLQEPMALARRDPTVARADGREGLLLAEGREI